MSEWVSKCVWSLSIDPSARIRIGEESMATIATAIDADAGADADARSNQIGESNPLSLSLLLNHFAHLFPLFSFYFLSTL